jgi:Zn-dependent protease with chaperone function
MTREKFTALITRLDQRYAHRPAALKRVTLLWTVLGFCGFFLIIAGRMAAGLALAIIGLRAEDHGGSTMLILGGAALMAWGLHSAVRMLWVESEPPEGLKLTPETAPALFGVIADLRRQTCAKPLHSVVLTGEFNASMYQQPRLGWLGFMQNHLILGLPLLDSQAPDEVRGIIAHELAHLSGEHGRTGAWIYRLRKSWSALHAQMQERQGARGRKRVLEWFVNWFWPRFNARAFVLSRANEYDADRTAARCAGAETMAGSLLRIKLAAQRLYGEFWPEFWKGARHGDSPPPDSLGRLAAFLHAPTADADEKLRRSAFRTLTTNDDTHPSLSDRWRSLGVEPPGPTDPVPPVPAVPEQSAAQAFLGDSLAQLRSDTERTQQRALASRWAAERAWAEAQASALAAGACSGEGSDDDAERLWSQAQNHFALHEDDRAVELLSGILTVKPSHLRSRLSLACHLLEKDDAGGVPHAQMVLDSDDSLAWPAGEALYGYYARTGDANSLASLQRHLDVMEREQKGASAALGKVSSLDRFTESGLTKEALLSLRSTLAGVHGLRQAWIASKVIPGTSRKLFVLLVSRSGLPAFGPNIDLTRRTAAAASLPGRFLVITARTQGLILAAKVRRHGTQIL